tara:strand:- start:43 stop:258 length:216 start_codon:yes stop_codon:yes gene_type:complete
MDDLIDLIATDQKASEVTDKIKDLLYTKAASKVDSIKSDVAVAMFDPSPQVETEPEVEQEVSDEPAEQEES